ncbi:MAG: FecR domain-containing protein [Verrucomicrobia bacterium]|nr:FecR domain-containing protein [Verrucomicrobiota bacterium]MBI3869767.1 FecR domain-containing protein [Verrucomicrobiota bacterium]
MKWPVFVLWCCVGAMLASAPGAVQAQSRDIQSLVRSINGPATYSIGKGPSVPIKPGMRIPAGCTIQSGVGTTLDLFLGRGGGVLRVKEGTIVRLDKLTLSDTGSDVLSETQITLVRGEILGAVNRLPEGATYEVRTPEGLAGVRGARFKIQVPGNINVLDGTLVYVRNNQAHVIKGPGEFSTGLPQLVRVLLPAEIPPLARQFIGMDASAQTAQRVRPPPPQESPLSPVVGS